MSFFGELRRRNVFRAGIAYLAAVWVLIEVTDTLVSIINAPAWIPQVLVYSAALGFPLTLVLAWFYELTPEGIKATADVETVEPVRFMGRKLDFAIIGLLVLAVGFLLVRSPPDDQTTALPNSLAVLPFQNLSPDPDDAYFAAGIHESTLNQLAKIQDLSIIARTSVLPYENNPMPVPEIAEALNVEMVMEGSVRYADDRVLITAQLIDGRTGSHLWSEEFNRTLTDIFAIQAEIATRIAMELETQLSTAEQESLSVRPTESQAAYALYLRALETMSFNEDSSVAHAEQAIALDENFALAYAVKARVLGYNYAGEVARAARESTEAALAVASDLEGQVIEAAERALELDPTLGLAHAALGVMHTRRWRRDEAAAAFAKAYELTPNDTEVLNWYSFFYSLTNRFDDSIDMALRAVELDPQGSIRELADAYFFAGRFDAAAAIHEARFADDDPFLGGYEAYAEIEAARGNSAVALENLAIQETLDPGGSGRHARAAYVYSRLGQGEDAARKFEGLQQLSPSPIHLAIGHLSVGNTDEALRLLRELAESELPSPGTWLTVVLKTNLYNDPVLERPEFVEVRSRLGFRD